MKSGWLVIAACAIPVHALADTHSTWDGAYAHATGGGGELCPASSAAVTIAGGKVSIGWTVSVGDRQVTVGRIDGTVHANGDVDSKVTLLDPSPAAVVEMMRDTGDVNQLKSLGRDLKLSLRTTSKRELQLAANMCYGTWTASAPPASAPDPSDAEPAPSKPASKAPAKPAPASKPARSPAPLAAGAPAWDATYASTAHGGQDWRCPKAGALASLVVKTGRFSIPWRVDASDGHEVSLGQLDGSIAARGKVTLRATFSVDELPAALLAHRPPAEATLASVRALAPAMTFAGGEDGKPRTAHLALGSACSYDFAAKAAATRTATKPPPPATPDPDEGRSTPRKPTPPAPKPEPRETGRTNGAECSYASECASGKCDFHKCTSRDQSSPKLGNGVACSAGSECASGNCSFGTCTSTGGKPELGNGVACHYDYDCASHSCDSQKCR